MHEISWASGKVVCSYSRRRKGRIACYVTLSTTKKTDKIQSQLFKLFRARSLSILTLLFCLASQKVSAEDFSASINNVDIQLQNSYYQLNADIHYNLSPTAREALQKGIPLSWQILIKIQQPGIIWDTTLKKISINYQIRNHALLNLYSVKESNDNSKHMFSSLTVALNSMSKLRDIRLIDKKLLASNIKYSIVIKTQFNHEALPTPLRPMSYFNSQWSLSSPWSLWQLQN